jgi:hypothetical protein
MARAAGYKALQLGCNRRSSHPPRFLLLNTVLHNLTGAVLSAAADFCPQMCLSRR